MEIFLFKKAGNFIFVLGQHSSSTHFTRLCQRARPIRYASLSACSSQWLSPRHCPVRLGPLQTAFPKLILSFLIDTKILLLDHFLRVSI